MPGRFAALFKGCRRALKSHRGYDIGALELAEFAAGRFGATVHFSAVTRLLVDLNRSPGNPRRFSEISGRLGIQERESVMRDYYFPYRRRVESEVDRFCREGEKVLHLSVHTFTPVLGGKVRNAGIGLLYDPGRSRERLFCSLWKRKLREIAPALKVRLNYPYSGRADGFTGYLRSRYEEELYLGVELEVNQEYAAGRRKKWLDLQNTIVNSLAAALDEIYKNTARQT